MIFPYICKKLYKMKTTGRHTKLTADERRAITYALRDFATTFEFCEHYGIHQGTLSNILNTGRLNENSREKFKTVFSNYQNK